MKKFFKLLGLGIFMIFVSFLTVMIFLSGIVYINELLNSIGFMAILHFIQAIICFAVSTVVVYCLGQCVNESKL